MTIVELTAVIFVLLALISILFFSSQAWKRGSDRAGCILNIRQVQVSLRSYQNLNDLPQGHSIDLLSEVMGPNGFMNPPTCPANGTYQHVDTIPAPGELATECTLGASSEHEPPDYVGW